MSIAAGFAIEQPAAIRSLRREPRKYVPATIREGDTIYTNVELHLRGSIGSFRPVDDKPGLTIKIEKGAQRFHGLKKFHLNNSVQDPTYLSEWLCTDLFRRAGRRQSRDLLLQRKREGMISFSRNEARTEFGLFYLRKSLLYNTVNRQLSMVNGQ